MPKRRHQSGLCEQSQRPLFLEVENDRAIVRRVEEHAHHAVTARIGGSHHARVATDHDRRAMGLVWLF